MIITEFKFIVIIIAYFIDIDLITVIYLDFSL